MTAFIVGLTGGIGSGKSTVADLFAKEGAEIIDADLIARELVKPDLTAYEAIVKHFGNKILLPDKTINRPYLRKIIFQQQTEKVWLEKLLHPLIIQEIKSAIQKISYPYAIVIIPLLIETGSYEFIQRILVVDATEEQQCERVQARDDITESQTKNIIATQLNRSARLAQAHDVINNDGSLEKLLPQVKKLHQRYLRFARTGEDPYNN